MVPYRTAEVLEYGYVVVVRTGRYDLIEKERKLFCRRQKKEIVVVVVVTTSHTDMYVCVHVNHTTPSSNNKTARTCTTTT